MAESSGTATSHSSKKTISDDVWDEAVNEWLNTSMRNTAASQSTEGWNHLVGSLPELRKILESKI